MALSVIASDFHAMVSMTRSRISFGGAVFLGAFLLFLVEPMAARQLGLYPSLIEPHLTLQTQRIAWTCGFAIFDIVSARLTWMTRSAAEGLASAATADEADFPRAPLSHQLLWVLLPMGAAMQLSAVTSYITANVAAI